MDFISVRDFRTKPGEVWKKRVEHHCLVITRNSNLFAILTETSPTALDHDLDTMTLDEVNAVSREARDERRHETRD